MAIATYIVLLCSVIRLITTQELCVERLLYYISSRTGIDSEDCLKPGQIGHPCASLSYLSHNIRQCATMEIMGDITLKNTVLKFNSSWSNITLIGSGNNENGISIYCEGHSGIYLNSSLGFYLESLRFIGCSLDSAIFNYHENRSLQTSVIVENSRDVHVRNCSFYSSCGSGLLLINVMDIFTIVNSTFIGSKVINKTCISRMGGLVIRMSSSFTNTSIDIVSCNFTNNYNRKNTNNEDCTDDSSLVMCQQYNECGGAINIVCLGPNLQHNVSILVESCLFHENFATSGGAVSILVGIQTLVSIVNTKFIGNKALCQGGAVVFELSGHTSGKDTNLMLFDIPDRLVVMGCKFISNSAYWGGAIAASTSCTTCHTAVINLTDSYWVNNSASSSGLAIGFRAPSVYTGNGYSQYYIDGQFLGCKFENNWPIGNAFGVVSAEKAAFGCLSSKLNFTNNSGTAVVMKDSSGIIGCRTIFKGNSGTTGGAIYLEGDSNIDLGARVDFADNTASVFGGAVYSRVTVQCTFDIYSEISSVYFSNNSAYGMEQSIYIENIGSCGSRNLKIIEVYNFLSPSKSEVLFPLFNFDVSVEAISEEVMLGEYFYIKPHNLTDYFGRPSVGIGYLNYLSVNSTSIEDLHIRGPNTITLDNSTRRIKYYFYGSQLNESKSVVLHIHFERHTPFSIGRVEINFTIIPCRFGYKYSPAKGVCECVDQSRDYILCSKDVLCIKRHYWYSVDTHSTYPCPVHNCLYAFQYCPDNNSCSNAEDFCQFESPDELCFGGRSKLLCSECATNNAFTFAALKCTTIDTCNGLNAFLLVFILFLYCILFIVGLLLSLSLKISVGSGFMYGVVYFFSIATIYTRSSELYSHEWLQVLMSIDTAITLFNPELLGYIDICFIEKWRNPLPHEIFRLLTPVFIISSICVLVLLSRYCRCPKRFSLAENSPIHAICLLILLSYTSISFSSLRLLIPIKVNGHRVVQMAPTVPYFSKEHIPFVVVALFAEIFFSLPLCIFFLFAPFISRWVNLVKWKLKPVLDEFQACYRPECRAFAGFYFLARQVIYFTNGILTESFPHYNNILTTINILILFIHATVQPYSKKWLNILDMVLLTDIVVLSMLSPVKLEIPNATNSFLYSTVMPYTTIIIPTILLFGAIFFVCTKKLLAICKARCFTKYHRKHYSESVLESSQAISSEQNSVNVSQEESVALDNRKETSLVRVSNSSILRRKGQERITFLPTLN